MGDTFNFSGTFKATNMYINSTLNNVRQTIGEIHSDDQETRKELEKLIDELNEALQKAPKDHQEQVNEVAQNTKALVDVAKDETPDRERLQITAESLKKAAQNLVGVMPEVANLAGLIVAAVMKLAVPG